MAPLICLLLFLQRDGVYDRFICSSNIVFNMLAICHISLTLSLLLSEEKVFNIWFMFFRLH